MDKSEETACNKPSAFDRWLKEYEAARDADALARGRVVAIAALFVEGGASWTADLAEAVREQKAAADRYYAAAHAQVAEDDARCLADLADGADVLADRAAEVADLRCA